MYIFQLWICISLRANAFTEAQTYLLFHQLQMNIKQTWLFSADMTTRP